MAERTGRETTPILEVAGSKTICVSIFLMSFYKAACFVVFSLMLATRSFASVFLFYIKYPLLSIFRMIFFLIKHFDD